MIRDEQYPIADWKHEVNDGNTHLGYMPWRESRILENLTEDHPMNEMVLILLQKGIHIGMLSDGQDRFNFLWASCYCVLHQHCEMLVSPSMDDDDVRFSVSGLTGEIYTPEHIRDKIDGLADHYRQAIVMHKDVPVVKDFHIYNKLCLT